MERINKKRARRSRLVFDWLEQAAFPRFCVSCGQEGELLCQSCTVNWQPLVQTKRCVACRKASELGLTCETCKTSSHVPDGVISAFSYADPIARELICAWKYNFDWTAWQVLQPLVASQTHQLRQVIDYYGIQTVVPIELHPRRWRERAFDQSVAIADFLSSTLGLVSSSLIERRVYTTRQAILSIGERRQAMQRNPFVVPGSIYVPKQLLLVDDVWTTGATAGAAVDALRQAGAEKVWVFTVADGSR